MLILCFQVHVGKTSTIFKPTSNIQIHKLEMVQNMFLYLCAKGFSPIHILTMFLGSKPYSMILWLLKLIKRFKAGRGAPRARSTAHRAGSTAGRPRSTRRARGRAFELAGGPGSPEREREGDDDAMTSSRRQRRPAMLRRTPITRYTTSYADSSRTTTLHATGDSKLAAPLAKTHRSGTGDEPRRRRNGTDGDMRF